MFTFDPGSRVVVKRARKYHNLDLKDKFGTVSSHQWRDANIAVKLDDVDNPRSEWGYFYFSPSEIELLKEANNIVKEKTMTKIINYMNVAHVALCDSKDRNTVYACANFDGTLDKGDLCVFNSDGCYRLGRVVDIKDPDGKACFQEIVSRVDTLEYDNRVLIRKAADELKAKMEARAKQLQDIALYQMLAKDDPDMAALLSEYQSLNKV